MTTDPTLLRAILAMDAYNRGYAPGIKNLGGGGSQIGEVTILNYDLPNGAQAAGFYAVAYSTAAGGKIISYRGTDQNTPNWWARTGMGSDLWSGYGIGAGYAPGEGT
jgi:hypothetical protein